jgi:hypothetical protein
VEAGKDLAEPSEAKPTTKERLAKESIDFAFAKLWERRLSRVKA